MTSMKVRGILAFCNPIVDSFAFVSDEFLVENDLEKGGNLILDNEKILDVTRRINLEFRECGGSGMNIARWIGILGYRSAVVGQYGDDERGSLIAESLNECHVENRCIIKPNGITTNLCICVTPDAQRTMIGIFGASHEKYVKPIDTSIISEYEMILLEGYVFANSILMEVNDKAIQTAIELKKKIALVISGVFHIPGYKENLLKYIDQFSIVTGTQEEFSLLFDKPNLEDLLSYLEKSKFELCAVTMGDKGCFIIHNSSRLFVSPPEVEKVIDTTGAGDSFTAGLLFGYLNQYSIEKSIWIAKVLAGHTIAKIGVVINRDVKQQVENLIKSQPK